MHITPDDAAKLQEQGVSIAQATQMWQAAQLAYEKAYAPYSQFQVGVALLDAQGRLFSGCNVENAAFPQGVCAEGGAISAMVLGGSRQILAILVYSHAQQPLTPCGGCRQKILEFALPNTLVGAAGANGWQALYTMQDLIPHSFGAHYLNTEK